MSENAGYQDATSFDSRFEEEPCNSCGGDGCYACNDTGFQYTDAAIRLQLEDS